MNAVGALPKSLVQVSGHAECVIQANSHLFPGELAFDQLEAFMFGILGAIISKTRTLVPTSVN